MDVRTLRDRIVDLSQHGIGNDVDVNTKALAWLNSAYHELMDDMIPLAPAALQIRVDVAVGNDGAGVLTLPVHKLVHVVARNTNTVLRVVTPAEVLEAEISGLGFQEPPTMCSVSGNVLQVYPARAGNVSVVFVPRVQDLLENGSENSILVPPSLHSVLVWGALVWSALFDRGFMSQSEMLMYQRQWLSGKEKVRLSLLGGVKAVRVEPFGWV